MSEIGTKEWAPTILWIHSLLFIVNFSWKLYFCQIIYLAYTLASRPNAPQQYSSNVQY